jgi:hypothetical protein
MSLRRSGILSEVHLNPLLAIALNLLDEVLMLVLILLTRILTAVEI